MMTKVGLGAAALCVVLGFAPTASADPTAGHSTRVKITTPSLLCQIGSDDADAALGANVVCQGLFPHAPVVGCPTSPGEKCPEIMHWDQAVVTASGAFRYRDGNIGVGDNPVLDTLVPGQTYHIQGWTVPAGAAGITFTNDATGHGMTIAADGSVTAI